MDSKVSFAGTLLSDFLYVCGNAIFVAILLAGLWLLFRWCVYRYLLSAAFNGQDKEIVFGSWYKAMKDVTFKSTTVVLNAKEVTALARHADEEMSLIPSKKKSEEDAKCIESLTEKIDTAIKAVCTAHRRPSSTFSEKTEGRPSGAFVRLSYRSPKDAVFDALEKLGGGKKWKETCSAVQAELAVCAKRGFDVDSQLVKEIAAIRLTILLLKVTKGSEAVWLISNSHRTFEDLFLKKMNLEMGKLPQGVESMEKVEEIHVRAFEDELLPETELRGFVFNRRLTAISQYHCSTVVPLFCQCGGEVISAMVKVFFDQEVEPRLPYSLSCCVVDFVFLADRDSDMPRLRVIEVNPFGPSTGSPLLFDVLEKRCNDSFWRETGFLLTILVDGRRFLVDGRRQLSTHTDP